jgi:hypothetical protein
VEQVKDYVTHTAENTYACTICGKGRLRKKHLVTLEELESLCSILYVLRNPPFRDKYFLRKPINKLEYMHSS